MSVDVLHQQLMLRLFEIQTDVIVNVVVVVVIVDLLGAAALVEDVWIRRQRVRRRVECRQVVVKKIHYLGRFDLHYRVDRVWTLRATSCQVPVHRRAVEVDKTRTSAFRLVGGSGVM